MPHVPVNVNSLADGTGDRGAILDHLFLLSSASLPMDRYYDRWWVDGRIKSGYTEGLAPPTSTFSCAGWG